MPGYYDVALRAAEALGLREPTYMERLQRINFRDYAPSRATLEAYRPSTSTFDTTSLILGLAVGMGVGVAIGYAAKGNVAPTARRVRERTYEAMEGIQQRLPERLRVTRMEETPSPQREPSQRETSRREEPKAQRG